MDFKIIENTISETYVISAVKRAKRPNVAKGTASVCPFCLGNEKNDPEVYRVGGRKGDSKWKVRVIKNKYPFAPIHEVVIHSPDHDKNFDTLPLFQTELILQTYLNRFQEHKDKGWVYIFHNHGIGGGESLTHPHSQVAVIPEEINLHMQRLETPSKNEETQETDKFTIFCPLYSQWPDEVWVYPKNRGRSFVQSTQEEIHDLSRILHRLIQIMDLRHGNEFSFNFYIYPGYDWYLRLIPRYKKLGGLEVGTGIFVNTQDPKETIKFIKAHFERPNAELIRTKHRATYRRGV